jgi:hypothetical protein
MSEWIKSKSGIVYRPITKSVYPVVAYESGYGHPAVFQVNGLGELHHDEKHKLNDDKSLYRKWKKICVMYPFEIDAKKYVTHVPYCEVDVSTLSDEQKEDAFKLYVPPSIKDFVKPGTFEKFKDIIN